MAMRDPDDVRYSARAWWLLLSGLLAQVGGGMVLGSGGPLLVGLVAVVVGAPMVLVAAVALGVALGLRVHDRG